MTIRCRKVSATPSGVRASRISASATRAATRARQGQHAVPQPRLRSRRQLSAPASLAPGGYQGVVNSKGPQCYPTEGLRELCSNACLFRACIMSLVSLNPYGFMPSSLQNGVLSLFSVCRPMRVANRSQTVCPTCFAVAANCVKSLDLQTETRSANWAKVSPSLQTLLSLQTEPVARCADCAQHI